MGSVLSVGCGVTTHVKVSISFSVYVVWLVMVTRGGRDVTVS